MFVEHAECPLSEMTVYVYNLVTAGHRQHIWCKCQIKKLPEQMSGLESGSDDLFTFSI